MLNKGKGPSASFVHTDCLVKTVPFVTSNKYTLGISRVIIELASCGADMM